MNARARDEMEELYRGHRDAVYRFLLRDLRDPEEAEDVTQTAFLHAYRSVLRGGRPTRPRAWLFAIAANVRRRRFARAQRRVREVPLDDDVTAAPDPPRVDELRDALEVLPSNQRTAVVLREVAGLSYVEIAGQLGVSVGSVQMLLFRARRTLRDELETATRRASSFCPHWLAPLLQQFDRLALPARAAGVAAAAAVAAFGVTGSAPAAQAADPHDARPPLIVADVPRADVPAEMSRPARAEQQPAGRARTPKADSGGADRGAQAEPAAPVAPQAALPEPSGGAEGAAPRLTPSLPAAPPLPIPSAPSPAEAVPALPVPLPLPVSVPDSVVPALPALP